MPPTHRPTPRRTRRSDDGSEDEESETHSVGVGLPMLKVADAHAQEGTSTTVNMDHPEEIGAFAVPLPGGGDMIEACREHLGRMSWKDDGMMELIKARAGQGATQMAASPEFFGGAMSFGALRGLR